MMLPPFDSTTKMGTAGGTLLTIVANITQADVFKTAVLAAIGAAVSFTVTVALQWIVKRIKK